jgi:hypothetical protein
MVFCDGCNVGVHQLCYGIDVIPDGMFPLRLFFYGDVASVNFLDTSYWYFQGIGFVLRAERVIRRKACLACSAL